jgi:hypothetical protein
MKLPFFGAHNQELCSRSKKEARQYKRKLGNGAHKESKRLSR